MLEMARNYGPMMLAGLATTAWICFVASILGLIVGMTLALCDVGRPVGLRWIARGYIEIMRGLPILILLFLLYYGGPSFGVRLRPKPPASLASAPTLAPISPRYSDLGSDRYRVARSRQRV
jgi:His/Glu/Gln/Arg/opine family amino acid ABC transporter permease subunit